MNEQLVLSEIQKKHYIGGIRFDRVITIFICWFLGGLFLDAWAHNHGLVDKTFFTPWHAVLYSGYAACAFVLVATVFINHLRGYRCMRRYLVVTSYRCWAYPYSSLLVWVT